MKRIVVVAVVLGLSHIASAADDLPARIDAIVADALADEASAGALCSTVEDLVAWSQTADGARESASCAQSRLGNREYDQALAR